MGREKLIPKPPGSDDDKPKERFQEVASKVFSIDKSEIDRRDKAWQKDRQKPK